MDNIMEEVKKLHIAPRVSEAKVSELAEMGASVDDIGRSLGYSPNEWKKVRVENPNLEEAINKGQARLRISILSYQLEKAKLGDSRMLIWLGKQMLGQTEKAGEQKENVSFEREKEAVKKAIKKDPELVYKIFAK
jgi:hypothetical protein